MDEIINEIQTSIKLEFIKCHANRADVCLPPRWLEQKYMFDKDALPLIDIAVQKLVNDGVVVANWSSDHSFRFIRLTEKGLLWLK